MQNVETNAPNIPVPPPETVERVREILERLHSLKKSKVREYIQARIELKSMGYEAGCAIYWLLEPSISRHAKEQKRAEILGIKTAWILFGGCVVALIERRLGLPLRWTLYTLMVAEMPLAWLISQHLFPFPPEIPYTAVTEILSIEDPRMVPILLEIYPWAERSRKAEKIRERVIFLLSFITDESTVLCTAKQLVSLHKILLATGGTSTRLLPYAQVTILKALRYIGNDLSLKEMRCFADKYSDPMVKQCAQECLPVLEARVQRMGLDLLRASEAPALPNEEYLRPATASPTEPTEELLRSTGRNE